MINVMSKIHVLKTWPEHWKNIETGAKTFEVRKNDRGYAVGDILVLRMFSPNAGYMRDPEGFPSDISRRITHLLEGGSFGIKSGYVVMSISPLEEAPKT